MVKCESFSLAPETMLTKSTENLPVLAPPTETNNLFVKNLQDHPHLTCTGQQALTSPSKPDIGSFLRLIQTITLCGCQVFNLRYFQNDLSISLSAALKTNIEFLPQLSDLEISSPFRVLLLPLTDQSLHTCFHNIYKFIWRALK